MTKARKLSHPARRIKPPLPWSHPGKLSQPLQTVLQKTSEEILEATGTSA